MCDWQINGHAIVCVSLVSTVARSLCRQTLRGKLAEKYAAVCAEEEAKPAANEQASR
jgi:hypothetical protein